jgi:hypothetical protein
MLARKAWHVPRVAHIAPEKKARRLDATPAVRENPRRIRSMGDPTHGRTPLETSVGERYPHVLRCADLRRRDVILAVVSKNLCAGLLEHLIAIARPGSGGPMILLVFARMATTACVWLDGDLRVDVIARGDGVLIEVWTELGGVRGERVYMPMALDVPLAEFAGVLARIPQMVEPLRIDELATDRIVLRMTCQAGTRPPPQLGNGWDEA